MKRPYTKKHAEFFLPTQDDWHPNFLRDTVRIRVYESLSVRKSVLYYWGRICVWGNDDCGMEKDFQLSENEKIRLTEIKQILKEANDLPNPLNKGWLLGHGFKYA